MQHLICFCHHHGTVYIVGQRNNMQGASTQLWLDCHQCFQNHHHCRNRCQGSVPLHHQSPRPLAQGNQDSAMLQTTQVNHLAGTMSFSATNRWHDVCCLHMHIRHKNKLQVLPVTTHLAPTQRIAENKRSASFDAIQQNFSVSLKSLVADNMGEIGAAGKP